MHIARTAGSAAEGAQLVGRSSVEGLSLSADEDPSSAGKGPCHMHIARSAGSAAEGAQLAGRSTAEGLALSAGGDLSSAGRDPCHTHIAVHSARCHMSWQLQTAVLLPGSEGPKSGSDPAGSERGECGTELRAGRLTAVASFR